MTTSFVVESDIESPMRDGVLLRADLWGADPQLPRPAILVRTPYEKGHSTPAWFVPRCVLAGYVFVIQDCRGRFASDGETSFIMWEQEGRDAYDTIEWIAQQPWCDGNVGMMGGSYMGIMQWVVAALQPPSLRAIAPAMSSLNGLGTAESGGIPHLLSHLTWLLRASADWLTKRQRSGHEPDPAVLAAVTHAASHVNEIVRQTPLASVLANLDLPISLMSSVLDRNRGPHVDLGKVTVPTLSIGGWHDSLSSPTLALYADRIGRGDPVGRHRLIMGPWTHGGTMQATQGEVDFGPRAPIAAAGVPEALLAFFDEHLRGELRPTAPVRYFMSGPNEWRIAECWPPPGVRDLELFLASGGAANTAAGDGRLEYDAVCDGAGHDHFSYDPDDPVPTHGGKLMPAPGAGYPLGPYSHYATEARADVLCYTSPPLDEPIHAVGPVNVELCIASDARDTDFVARLVDVHPDGRPIAITDGAIRARYRDGLDTESWLTPGQIVKLRIALGQTAWRFDRGHRIRLDVTSSNFPHLDRNMNSGAPIGSDMVALVAHQQVWHDATHPSRLTISVLDSPS